MSEGYRLVFSGEVEEGQHPAVVKKRLTAVLKLDEERMEVLFSGKPVVVKKSTDKQTAARYQQAFQKAGARLRVLPADTDQPSLPATNDGASEKANEETKEETKEEVNEAASGEIGVMPLGSDVLRESERAAPETQEIDTSHLSLQGASFTVDEPATEPQGPDVDHLSLAEVGTDLGQIEDEVVIQEIEADFDLAEVGAIIGSLDNVGDPVSVPEASFDVAEPGADLSQPKSSEPPAAPDTSHIKLDD